jgi:hypothetical protein
VKGKYDRPVAGHADLSLSGGFAAASLRYAPSGDTDKSARLVGNQEVLVTIPAIGRFAHQNFLIATRHRRAEPSRLAERSEATGEAGLAFTASTSMASG